MQEQVWYCQGISLSFLVLVICVLILALWGGFETSLSSKTGQRALKTVWTSEQKLCLVGEGRPELSRGDVVMIARPLHSLHRRLERTRQSWTLLRHQLRSRPQPLRSQATVVSPFGT
jgi:hypothetical protein